MGIIDEEKLETAITYIQRIADGKNPVNNMVVNDDDVLNNPNVIRCMFFVKEVLEAVKRNGCSIGKKSKKEKIELLEFPYEVLDRYMYDQELGITKFVNKINALLPGNEYEKIKYTIITNWLKADGYLEEVNSEEFGKNITRATEKGKSIGIYSERRISPSNMPYMAVIYTTKAQEFVVKNLRAICDGEVV